MVRTLKQKYYIKDVAHFVEVFEQHDEFIEYTDVSIDVFQTLDKAYAGFTDEEIILELLEDMEGEYIFKNDFESDGFIIFLLEEVI